MPAKQRSTRLLAGAVAAGFAVAAARYAIRRRRFMDLANRSVLITGGSRGLGLDLARESALRGARVAICARDESELAVAREQLRRHAIDLLAIQCDVTVAAQVQGMIDGVLRHFGAIDFLINNAGIISVGPIETATADDFERAVQTHFSAAFHTTFAVLPSMRARRSGRIVNITSIGGKVPVPHLAAYCASKYAMVGFSEALRTELVAHGVYVTTVVPGLMRTGSARNVQVKGQHEKEYAWFATADVLPLLSMSARRAARRILDAACHGQAELVMPWTASLAAKFHGLFPGLSSEAAALVARLLPDAGTGGAGSAVGHQSDSSYVPKFARRRENAAAIDHNEFRPSAPQQIP